MVEPGDTPATKDAELGIVERAIIVGAATIAGLALWMADWSIRHHVEPFDGMAFWYPWSVAFISSALILGLCIVFWRDLRLWIVGAGIVGLFGGLSAYGASQFEVNDHFPGVGFVMILSTSLSALFYTAVPFVQVFLRTGSFKINYPSLFQHSWDNGLLGVLSLGFSGLCGLLLILWAKLFKLIGIEFFEGLFSENAFVYLFTGLTLGIGLVVGRTQHRALATFQKIVFAIFQSLLPVVAFVAVIFVLALPITGMERLWNTGAASAILMAFMSVTILLTNGVYRDGSMGRPYSALVRRMVELGLIVLPAYGAIAGYALWLRVDQHGWTTERVWATALCAALSALAGGYAYAVLRPGERWLGRVSVVNPVVAVFAIGFLLAANLPWVNPRAISVASQVGRLIDGKVDVEQFDFGYLRFFSGKEGLAALERLRDDPRIKAMPNVSPRVDEALSAKSRYELLADQRARGLRTTDDVRARLVVYPIDAAVPSDFLERFITTDDHPFRYCMLSVGKCTLIEMDLDDDQSFELVLFDSNLKIRAFVYARGEEADWRQVAAAHLVTKSKNAAIDFREGIDAGKVGAVAPDPKWNSLRVGGLRFEIQTQLPE